ncbi:MAG: IS3 family transposase, partial [Planctomycetota bacterium]|nr:IS3 family transposase [Planctomycetota bacterium]
GGRGRRHDRAARDMTRGLLEEAVTAGARRAPACQVLGLSVRTVERWRGAHPGASEDARHGPRHAPANKLSIAERRTLLDAANAVGYRELSPHQIVPRLADLGRYLGSESTLYRVLRAEELLAHRGRTKPPIRRPPRAHIATQPAQVWSWDITYLKTPVRGLFFYLYLMMDVWSRKIVGWNVYDVESAALAAALFTATCGRHHLDPRGIVLHADNGGPMKGATMVVTLERLGVLASFSRPSVSNDNPFSESLFRTLKYRPEYPTQPFADLAAARDWVRAFVRWYNSEHLHSAIRFVTPDDRHAGRDLARLTARQLVYERARDANPARWSGATRNWTPILVVALNPERTAPTLSQEIAA